MAEISQLNNSLGSVDTLVQRFIAQERGPINDLEKSKKALQKRQNVYTDLKSTLKSLNDLVKDFSRVGTLNNLLTKTAVSSNERYFSVTATSGAVIGNDYIKVDRLASSDTGVSARFGETGNDLASSLSVTQACTLAIVGGTP